MNKGKKIYFVLLLLIIFIVSTVYFSYAFFSNIHEAHGKLNIVAGTLDYKLESDSLENDSITVDANTIEKIVVKIISLNDTDSKYELYYLTDNSNIDIGYSTDTEDSVKGEIEANSSKEVTIYIRNNTNSNQTITFGVEGGLQNQELVLTKGNAIEEYGVYAENILNGAIPVLTDNLVPVEIAEDGTVTKADLYEKWYSYEDKKWANAVVLKDASISYSEGETILEDNIESYFVWIPKYSYQLWDLGDYSSLTAIDSTKLHTIPIKFGTANTSDSNAGECTTPGAAGESGNCKVGDYMTHPAFTAFDTNGFWVGKFETGYDGATTKKEAQVNSNDSSKIIVKPNVYSWRNSTIGNMFDASYNYLRDDESHMMKNTEWGAVAYLQHSVYGSQGSLRFNNNSSYITGYSSIDEPTLGYNSGVSVDGNRREDTELGVDGTYTVNYLNSLSNNASTTGNKSGVYDLSGGTWEYVMGYTTGATTEGGSSEITTLHSDFFTNSSWDKYYDKYSSTADVDYYNRILGDTTSEMGPFMSDEDPDGITRYKSSWYGDYADFPTSSTSWFLRGGSWDAGTSAGAFAFRSYYGGNYTNISFRVVLAP